MAQSHRIPAVFAMLVAMTGWGLASVFIRFLSTDFEPLVLVLVRYGSAAAVLVAVSCTMFPAEFRWALRSFGRLLPLSAVVAAHQFTWTLGCAGSTATTAQLVSKLSLVFIIGLSYFLFHEERAVIRSPWYAWGTALSAAGVTAVLSRDPASLMPRLDLPTIMLLATALLWAVYVVWCRHLVRQLHPVPLFTLVACQVTAAYAVLCAAAGKPSTLWTAEPRMTAVAALSGVICLALAHSCFHYAQKHLGAAVCNSMALLNPLITYAAALPLWADERLTRGQWCGAGALLLGTLLVGYASRQTGPRGPEDTLA